jgi:hypothetical protein
MRKKSGGDMRRHNYKRMISALTLIGSTLLFGCGKSEENQPAVGGTIGAVAPGLPGAPGIGNGQCMPIGYMSSFGGGGGSGSNIQFSATGITIQNNQILAGLIPSVGQHGNVVVGYNNMYYGGGGAYNQGYSQGYGGYSVQVADTNGAYGTLQMNVMQGPTTTASGTLNLNSMVLNEIYYKAAAAGIVNNQAYGYPSGYSGTNYGYGGSPYGGMPTLPSNYPTSGVCISNIAVKADKLLNSPELINVDVYVYLNNTTRALNVSTGQLF